MGESGASPPAPLPPGEGRTSASHLWTARLWVVAAAFLGATMTLPMPTLAAGSLKLTNLSGSPLDCLPICVKLPADVPRLEAASWQADLDDPSRVWLSASLPPDGSQTVDLGAPGAKPAGTIRWDAAASRGEIANGLVRVGIDRGETTFALADGRAILNNLSFYGWVTDTPAGPASPKEAQDKGVPGFNTRDYAIVTGREVASGPVFTAFELCKSFRGEAQGLVLTERFTLYAGSRDLEYRLTFENTRGRPLYIADCDGVFYGQWPKALQPASLHTSGGLGGTALSDWLGLSGAAPSPERGLWAAVTSPAGPALGIGRIGGEFQTWAFTKDGFWLYLNDAAGKRPIKLDPGQKLTWSLLLTATEAGGFEAADAIQRRCLRALRSPVTVALDARVLAEGTVAALGPEVTVPALLSPFDAQPLSDVAAFFTWQSVPHAGRYDVQLARAADFSDAGTFRAPALDADRSVWMPEQLPAPGGWHWRVRAVTMDGDAGEWSAPRSFTISALGPAKPSVHAPSSAKPLFILHAPSEVDKAWTIIPDDLKPYCALRVEVAERKLDLRSFCRTAEAGKAKVIIQCSGPGGGVYGEVYPHNHSYGRQSLSELEWAFDNCPNVIGALICEQNFHIRSDPTSAEYARRLADLVTAHGKLLIFADGHWSGFAWLKMGEDPRLFDIFRQHPHNVVPLWKMNCSMVPLTIHGAVLGYWTAGVVDQFGVEPESWYWFEAGFKGLGEGSGRANTGNHDMLPPTMWGQMLLTGLASGASCYCLEPYTWMWKYDHPDQPTDTWLRVVKPLLQGIVKQGLIPDRKTALGAVKIAVQTGPEEPAYDPNFGAFRPLYETLYGIRHPFEMIPDNARYGFIPLLPKLAAEMPLPPGMKRVPLAQLATPEAVRAAFEPLYPPVAEGDAFARFVGDTLVAMNNRENEDVTEHFEIPLGMPGLQALGGELGPHGFVVGQRGKGGLWLQVNGRAERVTTLYVRAERRPAITTKVSESALTSAWDAVGKTLKFAIRHESGAVELTIRSAER